MATKDTPPKDTEIQPSEWPAAPSLATGIQVEEAANDEVRKLQQHLMTYLNKTTTGKARSQQERRYPQVLNPKVDGAKGKTEELFTRIVPGCNLVCCNLLMLTFKLSYIQKISYRIEI